MTTRVYVEQAGCDRRRLDAESISSYLVKNGYELVTDPRDADRILAVVCAFKKKEEDESIRRLRSLRKYGVDILVYGCLEDIARDRYTEFQDLPSVSPRTIDTIDRHFDDISVPFDQVRDANVVEHRSSGLVRARRRVEARIMPGYESLDRRHATAAQDAGPAAEGAGAFNLFVCRGCRGTCSYCAIRRAIGGAVSKPVEQVLSEMRDGLEQGYRTFNILGDDPGCYGLDISTTLPQLLGEVFSASEAWGRAAGSGADRPERPAFNIREIHPKFLIRYHEEMLALHGAEAIESILCPIQSGSDRVLDRMAREHTSGELLSVVNRTRERLPGVRLDTQIIVGFPGETETDLEMTLDFLSRARFDSVVVFPYDDKQDTAASMLDDKVAPAQIRRRVRSAFRRMHKDGIAAYHSCP